VIVGINEADVQNLGQAIIPDGVYAKLLEKLKARHPRAIGLDIYRDQPVEPGHQELVRVFNLPRIWLASRKSLAIAVARQFPRHPC
jgi:CHASE2 domain-containing sensor protein